MTLKSNRRKAIKKVASFTIITTATVAAPAKWYKPSISAIITPAHAQTSEMPEEEMPEI